MCTAEGKATGALMAGDLDKVLDVPESCSPSELLGEAGFLTGISERICEGLWVNKGFE